MAIRPPSTAARAISPCCKPLGLAGRRRARAFLKATGCAAAPGCCCRLRCVGDTAFQSSAAAARPFTAPIQLALPAGVASARLTSQLRPARNQESDRKPLRSKRRHSYRSAKQSRLCGLISNCFPSEYFFSRYLIPKKGFFDARFASGRLCSASHIWR